MSSSAPLQVTHQRSATNVQRRTFVALPTIHVLGATPVNTFPTIKIDSMIFTPSAAVVAAYDSYRVVGVRWYWCFPDPGDAGNTTSMPMCACHDPSGSASVGNCMHILRYANHSLWFGNSIGGRFETIHLKNVTNLLTDGTLSTLPIKTDSSWNAGTIFSSMVWPNNFGSSLAGCLHEVVIEYDVELYGPRVDV